MAKHEFVLTLTRDMLGTNPSDPHVHAQHILEKQRALISDKSSVNSKVNKYLDQIQISKEKGEAEIDKTFAYLEEALGKKLSLEERQEVLSGKLEGLKETFEELDNKGVTVFFRDAKGLPCIGDHMIYGFMKAAVEAIYRANVKRENGTVMGSTSYTQSIINQHVRCTEQFISFDRDLKKDADGNPDHLERSLRAMTAKGPRVSLAKSEVVPAGAKLRFTLNVFPNSPLKEEHLKTLFDYGTFSGLGQWRNSGYGMFTYEMMTAKEQLSKGF